MAFSGPGTSTDTRQASASRGHAMVLQHLQAVVGLEASAIARAEMVSARTGQPLEQILNQLGGLSDEDLVATYAAVSKCPVWSPEEDPPAVDPEQIGVTIEFLRRTRVMPLRQIDGTLICAVCNPLDEEAVSGLVFATGSNIKLMVARPADWRRAFDRLAASVPSEIPTDERRLEREIDQVSDSSSEGSGARLVSDAFEAAIAAGASDIHFEPRRNDLRIRLRVDGRLVDHRVASADLAAPAVSRVKVIANLDLGEKRLPQDGRTTFVTAGRQVDVRVATSPTVFGESAVLRILDRTNVRLDLDLLGFSPDIAAMLRQAATSPHGMFLITGPTGSGKTTTLYALLETFKGSTKKVLSVEDPVEYHFEDVIQTQVAPHLGLTFAAALRSFLRQDPDVILVGEIRDPETAAVAVQAAMTGHFVLASVHANSALAVLPRLQDMGVEPYQLAAGFRGAAAQRLVRRLCEHCRRAGALSEAGVLLARSAQTIPPKSEYAPVGCSACQGTGFKGRLAIAEGFLASDHLLRAVADRLISSDVADIAVKAGLRGMIHDGLDKVGLGLTTADEVAAAVNG